MIKMTSTIRKLTACVLVIIIFLNNVDSSVSLRILGLFPFHGKSHFVMCEKLMRGLAARGHQVDVYSHFPLKKSVANYTDYNLFGSVPLLSNNMDYSLMESFSSGLVSIPQLLKLAGDPTCQLLHLPIFQKLIREPPNDPPYDLVIVEPFVANCYFAFGRHLKIPMIQVVTTTLFDWLYSPLGNPNNVAVEPSLFSKFMVPMKFFERLENLYVSTYVSTSFNYNARSQDAIVKKYFGQDFPNVIELQKDVALTLINYNHFLSGVRPFVPGIVPISGIHVSDTDGDLPTKVQKFLDESKDGFIYFSFGSMIRIETFPKPAIQAFYKTFEKIAPVRVLMKIAKPEELPPGLPSNVITYHWLPQIKVLSHKNIRAFVTHGGLMGTTEAIHYGVPLIGFPLFGDQHFNIESYAKKNFAIKLDRHNIKEETFTEAVFEILKNPKYKKSTEKIGETLRDLPMKPVDTAVFYVEYIARHGKDVFRSPLVDMPWWQASLLDIYGFVIFILLTALYITKIVIKILIGLIVGKQSQPKLKKN